MERLGQTSSRRSHLCGGKIADLQLQAADGRLAKNDGFIAAFNLNHTETLLSNINGNQKKKKNRKKKIKWWKGSAHLFSGFLQKSDGIFWFWKSEETIQQTKKVRM